MWEEIRASGEARMERINQTLQFAETQVSACTLIILLSSVFVVVLMRVGCSTWLQFRKKSAIVLISSLKL